MKKLLLGIALLGLAGCAPLTAWTSAQANCAANPACLEQAKKYAAAGQAVASPWGPIAGGAAASVITFIALGVLGLKKKKSEMK